MNDVVVILLSDRSGSGLKVFGPFDCLRNANIWAEKHMAKDYVWKVVTLMAGQEQIGIKPDEWSYVYTHSAQRARELHGVPPGTEVRLAEEQIDGALPCWAVKVLPQPSEESHWSGKGKIRLECRFCDTQHDEIAGIPPDWISVEKVRSWERATEPVDPFQQYNKYGDTVLDWQTHFGICPECR